TFRIRNSLRHPQNLTRQTQRPSWARGCCSTRERARSRHLPELAHSTGPFATRRRRGEFPFLSCSMGTRRIVKTAAALPCPLRLNCSPSSVTSALSLLLCSLAQLAQMCSPGISRDPPTRQGRQSGPL